MSDYNLHALDPRTFQHMCQALAVKEIGPGVTVFGDGPDGGRDAAYTGPMQYPGIAPWNGSLIMQMKFCQNPSGDAGKDGVWACKQLTAELEQFLAARTKRTRPDYFILVTNVDLTPAPEGGSYDKLIGVFQHYAPQLQFQGWDLWDGNKIRSLLDGHRDIAIRYGGYITSGDVLAKMAAFIEGLSPEFEQVMSDFLQAELTGPDQYARLSEAGSAAEQRTALPRVFVDLPVTSSLLAEPPEDKVGPDGRLPPGFIQYILNFGAHIPGTASAIPIETESKSQGGRPPSESFKTDGRFVLIGGPGQGKSTLCQFICQLYRAAILLDRPQQKVSREAGDCLAILDECCAHDKLRFPTARRFPVRIELKAFADDLNAERCTSLLDYIAQRIDRRSAQQVNRRDLDKWLGSYPWLLVLDGLDEVPASGNRADVIDQVRQFSAQCATREADIIIIATSRPQGYGEAFDARHYTHLYLAPLSTRRSLHYAQRLVKNCHPFDADLQANIMERLKRAAGRSSSERLMRSPLQITILAVLAELRGELPDDRWQLFHEYYETIMNRETQRNQTLSPVLREYAFEIGQLHEKVGFWLQTANEKAGGNSASLNRRAFDTMVRDSLSDRFAVESKELTELAHKINTAALERLVFLVSPQGEDIGFEIRSLQEFMAARELMDGTDEQIANRLAAIAPFPFWRNVFLFAAGKCAQERRYLVKNIIGICEDLNTNDKDSASVLSKAGSRLALDLLEDASFRREINSPRALAEIALHLLELPPDSDHRRLANVVASNPSFAQLSGARLEESLVFTQFERQLSAWEVLLGAANAGQDWAIEIAARHWPTVAEHQVEVLETAGMQELSPWLFSKYVETLEATTPWNALGTTRQRSSDDAATLPVPSWFEACDELLWGFRGAKARTILFCPEQSDSSVWLGCRPIDHSELFPQLGILAALNTPSPGWAAFVAGARFAMNPTAQELSRTLHLLVESNADLRNASYIGFLPWPLRSCLAAADGGISLVELSRRAEAGSFEDSDTWQRWEQNWCSEGISLEVLLQAADDATFSMANAWKHFPMVARYDPNTYAIDRIAETLLSALEEDVTNTRKQFLSQCFISLLAAMRRNASGRPIHLGFAPRAAQIRQVLEVADESLSTYGILGALNMPLNLTEEWASLLDWLAGRIPLAQLGGLLDLGPDDRPKGFEQAYDAWPDKLNLIQWIASLALRGIPCGKMEFPTITSDSPTALKAAVLIIQLSQGGLSHNDAISLSQDYFQWLVPDRSFLSSLGMLEGYIGEGWTVKFLENLMRQGSFTEHLLIGECVSLLNKCILKRHSPLQDPIQLKRLGFEDLLEA